MENERLAVAYGVAVVGGLIPIFVSAELWFMPALAMAIYFAWGYQPAREAASVFEFADSVYYLGFTLSVGSLIASLEPFSGAANVDTDSIFRYFGLGMLTTLIGVVGRTILQTFHRSTSETLESINRQITEQATIYLSNLDSASQEVVATLETASKAHRDKIVPHLSQLESDVDDAAKKIGAAMKRLTVIDKHIETIQTAFANVAAATGLFVEEIDSARESVADGKQGFGQKLTALQEQLEKAASTLHNSISALVQAGSKTADSLVKVETPATLVATRLSEVSDLSKKTADALALTAERSILAATEIGKASDAVKKLSEALTESGRAIDAESLELKIKAVGSELDHVSRILRQQRETANAEGLKNKETSDETLKAATALNKAISEIVAAIELRLERIA